MARIYWRVYRLPKLLYNCFKCFFQRCKYTFRSLTHNHFMDNSYAADVCMEPLFWFVDNSTYAIGPFFVVAVVGLTASVVFIAYWLGLPYWWNRNPIICVFLVIFGNWLLLNVCFHYYKAVTTYPGYPPQGELITEAVSICKKCISPKPPRTHHCSVCNRCILKMDHHCPWLNNCVGYKNHRYFFLYMAYMVTGVLFLLIFGAELAYNELWLAQDELDDPVLEGHPVKLNKTGSIIMMTDQYYQQSTVTDLPHDTEPSPLQMWRKRAIIYMALLNTGVLFALGGLLAWHSRLASKGETSIEANINKAETTRLAERGRVYVNPYNFGSRKNWRLFLGLVKGRTWWRHVFFPSGHDPIGDGLTWHTVNDEVFPDEWP